MIIASFLTATQIRQDKTNERNRARKSLTIREIREAPSAEYISDVPLRT